MSVPATTAGSRQPVVTFNFARQSIGRIRPPHYLVVERHVNLGVDFDEEPEITYEVSTATDDLGTALADAEDSFIYQRATWDNWDGSWVAVPDWADEIAIAAEGYARYDARPTDGEAP